VGGGSEVSLAAVVAAHEKINRAEFLYARANQTLYGNEKDPRTNEKKIEDLKAEIEANKEEKRKHGKEYNSSTGQFKWVDYNDKDFALKHDLSTLVREGKIAHSEIDGLRDALAAAKKDWEDIKGANQTLAAAHKTTETAQHAAGMAATEANKPGGLVATENSRFNMDVLERVLKDTGLSPADILNQGAASMDDMRQLLNSTGYDTRTAAGQRMAVGTIKTQGEQAEHNQAAGLPFDQGAIARLEEYQRDQQSMVRFNELLAALGDNGKIFVKIINEHSNQFTSLSQEQKKMWTAWEDIKNALHNQVQARPVN
jgi:hypothetical protein